MKTKTASQLSRIQAAGDFARTASGALSDAEEPLLAARVRALAAEIEAIRMKYATLNTAAEGQR